MALALARKGRDSSDGVEVVVDQEKSGGNIVREATGCGRGGWVQGLERCSTRVERQGVVGPRSRGGSRPQKGRDEVVGGEQSGRHWDSAEAFGTFAEEATTERSELVLLVMATTARAGWLNWERQR